MAVKPVRKYIKSDIKPKGSLVAYERRVGEELWRPVVESDNVILDQWYVDMFGQIAPSPPGGMSLLFGNLALGYKVSPAFTRTDIGLGFEWGNAFAKLTSATGTSPITSLAITAAPYKIASGQTITLGAQTLTLTADMNLGDTSVSVASFTPSINYPIGTVVSYINAALIVPQRLPASIGIIDITDPPSIVLSYFLSAAANLEPVKFTEAGLVYNANASFGSHVAFAYTKDGNTDLRVDYTLTREADE